MNEKYTVSYKKMQNAESAAYNVKVIVTLIFFSD